MDMVTVLNNISLFVTEAIDWITAFVGVITANPLLLCFVIVSFVGLGVGLIRRLISL